MGRIFLLLLTSGAISAQVATNLTAVCNTIGDRVTIGWLTAQPGVYARLDTNPPGVAWPPSSAFVQQFVASINGAGSWNQPVTPGQSYVTYLTAQMPDGGWPMSAVVTFTCAPPPPQSTAFSAFSIGTGFFRGPALPGSTPPLNVDFGMVMLRVPAPAAPGPCSPETGTNVYALDPAWLYLCAPDGSGGFRWARLPLETAW